MRIARTLWYGSIALLPLLLLIPFRHVFAADLGIDAELPADAVTHRVAIDGLPRYR